MEITKSLDISRSEPTKQICNIIHVCTFDNNGHRQKPSKKSKKEYDSPELKKVHQAISHQKPCWYNKLAKEEIEATEDMNDKIKTWKLLTMHRSLHPKFSTLKLYKKWNKGGKGRESIRTTRKTKTGKSEYIREMSPQTRCSVNTSGSRNKTGKNNWKQDEKNSPCMAVWGRGSRFLPLAVRTKRQHRGTDYVKAGIKHTRQRSPWDNQVQEGIESKQEKHKWNVITKLGLCTGTSVPSLDWNLWGQSGTFPPLCTFEMQTDKHLMANEWGIVVVDIADKKAVAIDVALSNNSNI